MSSPWPFVAWGMDVIDTIDPAASNGQRFILVAIDYFTKWVEAVSYKSMTKKVVADFVCNNLICRAVEDANKNIKKILRKMIDNHRVRTLIGATPYLLVYGIEVVIPAEVEIPSLRIIQEARLSNAELVRKRIDQLIFIDEKRMVADEYKEKFSTNWKGTYMVRKVLSGGALILLEMDGIAWPKPINSDVDKIYYV
ncbi:uncharacterized protein LOC107030368 [Solanum pennellii]|uniref:Uncharacterized protein LOC107030368 n=1 Tax=Solanum pennellii TaxID=28526 RepID=A0ABM1HL87_SOLPN|nr:uncharacterized protein LOC107030368 [Solanum pennellii]